MRAAGVEPDVHDVGDFLVALGFGAQQLAASRSNQASMPRCSTSFATLLEQLRRARMQLAVRVCDEQRDRHAPGALARDAPVGPALDHAVDALLAPVGRPLHLADLSSASRAQACLVHADEPLRRGAEDDRRLVAPAMRIAVTEWLMLEQHATLAEHIDDVLVRLEHLFTGEESVPGRKRPSRRPDCRVAIVLDTDDKVLLTVARRRVHGARAGIERDVHARITGTMRS